MPQDPPIGGVVPQATDPPIGGVVGGVTTETGPSVTGRVLGPVADALNPINIAQGVYHIVASAVDPREGAKLAAGVVKNLIDHLQQGREEFSGRGATADARETPWTTGAARMAGGLPVVGPFFDAVANNDVPSMAGQALALGAQIEGPGIVTRLASKAAKVAAPAMVDAALGETPKMRGKFPNSAQRSVTEGVILKPDVVARSKAIEGQLSDLIAKRDAETRTGTTTIPLGEAPTGESAAMVSPQMPRPSMIDPRRMQGGGDAAMPFANAGTGPRPTAGFGGPGVMIRETVTPANPVAPSDLMAQAKAWVIDRARLKGQGGRGFRAEAQAELDALAQKYLAENPNPLTLSDTLGLKRAEQELSSPTYNKRAAGSPMTDIESLWHEGLAAAARRKLLEHVPQAEGLLKAEQELIGLRKAVERADQPIGATIKNKPTVKGAVTGVAMSPRILGRAGLATQSLSELLDQIAPWANRLTIGAQTVKK